MIETIPQPAVWPAPPEPEIFYPETDGQPMAENTEQFDWIVLIKEGLEWCFCDDPNKFIAGDLFWYPVKGNPAIRTAPDTLVVDGRPKGRRSSYKQWEEGGIAPHVTFEVLSPGNTKTEMDAKFDFYERYGVEEYYLYDPERRVARGWRRIGNKFVEIPNLNGWVSPRLGIRFEITANGELQLFGPDGTPFVSFVAMARQWKAEQQQAAQARLHIQQAKDRAEEEHLRAEQEKQRAEQEKQRAEQQEKRAEQEKERAEQETMRAEQESQSAQAAKVLADEAKARAERLAAQLRALGVDPEA